MKEYTCDECGGRFTSHRPQEEAEAEAFSNFGVLDAHTNPQMAEVCQVCYREIMERARREGLLPQDTALRQ